MKFYADNVQKGLTLPMKIETFNLRIHKKAKP